MTQMIDMSQLPAPPCVLPVKMQAELDGLLDAYTAGMRTILNDGAFTRPLVSDPVYQALATVAYRISLRLQQTNEQCKGTMLAYALAGDLDQIGATFGVLRLTVTPADDSATPKVAAVMESDSRFRLRIQMALESWTTAGSRGSYEYHALSASAAVLDVLVDRPEFERRVASGGVYEPIDGAWVAIEPPPILLYARYDARLAEPLPGDVAVTLLLAEGADAASVQALVAAALDAEEVIPLTDNVHLLDAEIVGYAVEATLYCYPGPSAEPIVAAAQAALLAYAQAHFRLGHDIAVSGLYGAAHQAGVQRAVLNITADIVVQPWQAARCTGVTVTLGGRDV